MITTKTLVLFLVDDDEDDRMLFRDALQRTSQDARLIMSQGSENLLDELTALPEQPDAIFLDLNMPRRNGLECLDLLRMWPVTPLPKLVVISTSSSRLIIEKTRQRGADYYIQKPGNFREFQQVLALCLHKITQDAGPDSTFLINDLLTRP